jgi:IclR helix-turn-helix domain
VSSSRLVSGRAGRSSERPARSNDVTLRLTEAQIAEICAAVGLLAGTGDLLAGVSDDPGGLRDLLDTLTGAAEHKLSQSFVRGLFVLAVLPSDGKAIGVVELAKRLEMSPSTVHRYLLTLVMVGLAKRDERTRVYSRLKAAVIPK